MYTSKELIKEEIETNWDSLESSPYPEDLLNEMADGYTPVYYSDIIKDWTEMPSEFTDSWKDHYGTEIPEDTGITALMTVDVAEYYRDLTFEIYEEVKNSKEEDSEDLVESRWYR